ncbi:DUF4129 domain-containing protein [Paenibacillus physcomitrellae]|uniref:DUF4129 domain-containing protein n=1 Tax=Paenibacillus physcomitrellae TaxID=1619311 RepID=A0ABQ1G1W9_9BACL|nr:DUF4129 domain-containing protein [Paenibacillus physcomitrellae]GGA35508.1 hypothetical protein GCM10010917_20910 [Paenibacillus physcomitrellae]
MNPLKPAAHTTQENRATPDSHAIPENHGTSKIHATLAASGVSHPGNPADQSAPPLSASRKRRFSGLGKTLSFSLLEAGAVYPFIVLLTAYAVHQSPLLFLLVLWLAHAAAVLLGIARAQGSMARSRLGTSLLIAAALLLPAAVLGIGLPAVVAAAALLAAAVRGLVAGRKQWLASAPLRLPLIGLGAALVMYITAGQVAVLEPHRTSMYVIAMLVLFMLLLRWNGERVYYASHAQETDLPLFRRILAVNRSLTWVVIVVIAVLGGWRGFGSLILLLRDGLRSLLSFLESDAPPQEPPPMPAEPAQMPNLAGMDEGPARNPLWLEIAGYVVLALIGLLVTALLGFGIYRLIRRWLPERIRRLLRSLAYRLGLLRSIRQMPAEAVDFVDEVERIDRLQTGSRGVRGFMRRRKGFGDEDGNDPRRAYESLIRRAVRKGYTFRPSRTPAENGSSMTSNLAWTERSPEDVQTIIERYNAVRYGRGKPEE